MAPTADSRAAALSRELRDLLTHPRAAEILDHGWLHDGDLPMPGVDAWRFLAVAAMDIPSIQEDTERADEATFISNAVATVLPLLETGAVQAFLDRAESHRLATDEAAPGERFDEWAGMLEHFLFPDGEHAAGQRLILRRVIEGLFLRAVFQLDSSSLRGLAAAVDFFRTGQFPGSTGAKLIASKILYWNPRITSEWGEPPTKSQLKEFLLALYPEQLSTSDTTWAKAYEMVGWPGAGDRKGSRDKDKAIALARQWQDEA